MNPLFFLFPIALVLGAAIFNLQTVLNCEENFNDPRSQSVFNQCSETRNSFLFIVVILITSNILLMIGTWKYNKNKAVVK